MTQAKASEINRFGKGWNFALSLPSGAVLRKCYIGPGLDGGLLVRPPRSPKLDERGNARRDANSRPTYEDLIVFVDRAARDRFEQTALAALREAGVNVSKATP